MAVGYHVEGLEQRAEVVTIAISGCQNYNVVDNYQ